MMNSNPTVNHIHSPGQTSERTAPSHRTGTTQAILTNSQNSHIHDNTIVTNVKAEPSLKVLHKRVARNAILNAGGRADEVGCHPGTRKEVIEGVEQWRKAEGPETPPIFWLSGPAGAGKSAIVQTVAESCKKRELPQANFFFFRGDTSRSHVSPLISTLLYQVMSLYPSLRGPIATLLSADPVILDSPLEDQLQNLILNPLYTIQRSSPVYQPLLIFIDGLDECDSTAKDNQERILIAFDRVLVGSKPSPFRLLVASRDESQIQLAFKKISSQCRNLYLDDKYSPEDDIRAFVEAQFAEVRRTHGLAHTLDAAWPSANDIDAIVKKSSGQFIYAATVMRFILRSSASPILSLERVQGAARLATKSPFAHLDAIYTYILTQVDDQDALKDILHAQSSIGQVHAIAERVAGWREVENVLLLDLLDLFNKRYTQAVVFSCLADLSSIARYAMESHKLLFYHASFSDYLLDQSRSGDYFVNMAAFSYRIMPAVWQFIRHTELNYDRRWLQFGLCGITHLQELPSHLICLVSETPQFRRQNREMNSTIFVTIYNLCTSNDDIKHFRPFFFQWVNDRRLGEYDLDGIKGIPFGRMYYQMARARRGGALDPEMAAGLHPETDLDRDELSAWLKDFLTSRRQEVNKNEYKELLKTWLPWAIENNIPYGVLNDLPDVGQYAWRGKIKNWVGERMTFKSGSRKK